MAIKTTQEQLEAVQTAINQILTGGQSYAMGNRRLTRPDLPPLQKRERELLAQLARQNNGPSQNLARLKGS